MANSYTAHDQAADLGIHRLHSLVLGDPRKEARIAARFTPSQFKRPALGRGDIRHEEQQYNWETRMELDRIARRNNLKTGDLDEHDGTTLTEKIASWGSLKVDNAIARPDGLGTGNAHRSGPNYRPIATFGQPRRLLPLRPVRNLPGSSTFASRRNMPIQAGSVAAAWQAAALGKQFHPFVVGGQGSSPTAGTVRTRSPIRTPTRKSIVGSPPQRQSSPPPPRPQIQTEKQTTYANQMASTFQSGGADQKASKSAQGLTYADQMARIKSLISGEAAPHIAEVRASQQRSPAKVCLPSPEGLIGSRWSTQTSPVRKMGSEGSRWSGKLATSSDPYFQQVLGSPATGPLVSVQRTTAVSPIPETGSLNPEIHEAPESTAPSDTAPNTPASITTSAALDIEEYLDLLETEQDEQDELERYKLDPDRLQRDLEINERVNRSLAEAEEAALAREILSPRPERKTVQFVSGPSSPILGPEIDEQEVMVTMVYVWNTFRDFVTVRSMTGFEEYILEPRDRNPKVTPQGVASTQSDQSGEMAVEGKIDDIEKFEGGRNLWTTDKTIREISKSDNAQTKPDHRSDEKPKEVVSPSCISVASSAPSTTADLPSTSPSINVTPPTPLPASATTRETTASSSDAANLTVRKLYKVLNGRVITVDTTPTPSPPGQSPGSFTSGWESSVTTLHPPTIPEPPNYRPRTAPPPLNILRDVEPAPARSIWDMPSTPNTEVSGLSRLDSSHRYNTLDGDFFEGLSQSKKVEDKFEEKRVANIDAIVEPKAEVMFETNSCEPLISPIESSPASLSMTPIPSKGLSTAHSSASTDQASFFLPLTPTIGHISTSNAAVKTKGVEAVGTPVPEPKATETKPPLPHAPSALRGGMPVPVPHPLTPRPDMKFPQTRLAPKPIIAHKPSNLAHTAVVAPRKAKAAVSPVVGGLIDPFLQNLQPKARKASPASRPKTPRVSIDSNDSTPEKKEPSTEKNATSSYSEYELPSPTSLSSSWTFVENNKKEVPPAPPPTPVRKSSLSAAPTPAPTPTSTPSVPLSKPPVHATPLEPGPTSQSSSSRPRKPFFIVEIPLKDALIPVPVHESDDPQEVAEEFAREHNYESHCKDGKGGVERLVAFFNATHAQKTKEKDEKRAQKRAKMMGSLKERKA